MRSTGKIKWSSKEQAEYSELGTVSAVAQTCQAVPFLWAPYLYSQLMWVAKIYHQVRCLKDIKRCKSQCKLLKDVQVILLQCIVTMAFLIIAGLATCYTVQRRPKSGKHIDQRASFLCVCVFCSFFCKQNSKHVFCCRVAAFTICRTYHSASKPMFI